MRRAGKESPFHLSCVVLVGLCFLFFWILFCFFFLLFFQVSEKVACGSWWGWYWWEILEYCVVENEVWLEGWMVEDGIDCGWWEFEQGLLFVWFGSGFCFVLFFWCFLGLCLVLVDDWKWLFVCLFVDWMIICMLVDWEKVMIWIGMTVGCVFMEQTTPGWNCFFFLTFWLFRFFRTILPTISCEWCLDGMRSIVKVVGVGNWWCVLFCLNSNWFFLLSSFFDLVFCGRICLTHQRFMYNKHMWRRSELKWMLMWGWLQWVFLCLLWFVCSCFCVVFVFEFTHFFFFFFFFFNTTTVADIGVSEWVEVMEQHEEVNWWLWPEIR